MSDVAEQLQQLFSRQQKAYLGDMNPDFDTRMDRLNRAAKLIFENQDALCEALNEDYQGRHPYLSQMSEIMISLNHVKDAKKRLKDWMAPEKRKVPFPMGLFGAKAHIHYQPKGVVGIMSPWNFPIGMVFNPLATALAAGNRVMIKPSEFNPLTAELMAKLIAKYFAEDEVSMVTGGPEMGAEFSKVPFDHILFTGATNIGRMVMQSAAVNLTPVTLELGGKSPVIISKNANLKEAADKIMTGKCMNAGQVCVAPDYIYVPEGQLDDFVGHCKEAMNAQFPDAANNTDYTSIINQRHFERVHQIITDAKEKGVDVVALDNSSSDGKVSEHLKIPVHLAINPPEDSRVMQEEIFGPVAAVKTYQQIDDCLAEINSRPRPLAFYFFSNDKKEQKHVLNNSISGGVTLNNVTMHVSCQDLPFGGVGNSGIGHYHGQEGFKTFSHARGVFTDSKVNLLKLGGMLPPYSPKTGKMLTSQIKL